MAIQNPTPIKIEATSETIYDEFWASQVIVRTPTPTSKGSAFIELKPYNATTKEVLNQIERISIPDIWDTAEQTPEVAEAITALVKAVDIMLKKKIAADEERALKATAIS
jgi:hypothetical protein